MCWGFKSLPEGSRKGSPSAVGSQAPVLSILSCQVCRLRILRHSLMLIRCPHYRTHNPVGWGRSHRSHLVLWQATFTPRCEDAGYFVAISFQSDLTNHQPESPSSLGGYTRNTFQV